MQLTLQFSGPVPDSTLSETAGQQEAVSSWGRGPVCVTAGPGSGKTYVLVERFRRLVTEKGVDPRRILAVTFTEKAAQNLIERLAAGEEDPARRQAFLRAPVSTIDAFCAGLLREHALEAELDPEFSVMEAWEETIERQRVIREVLEQSRADDPESAERFLRTFAGFDIEPHLAEIHRALCASDTEAFARRIEVEPSLSDLIAGLEDAARRIDAPRLAAEALWLGEPADAYDFEHLRRLDDLAEHLKTLSRPREAGRILKPLRDNLLPRCRDAVAGAVHKSSREWLAETLRRVEQSYQQWKRSVSKCDYSDLERRAVRLLEKHPRLASRFDHVLVDEYQDTNPVQAKLMELLQSGREHRARTLFAVGDINQSIYGFRYAEPEVFRRFRGDIRAHGGHLVELPENHRSRPEILLAAETILSDAEGIERRSLTAAREFPPKPTPSVEVFAAHAGSSADARLREARHLAARILELKRELRLGAGSRKPHWNDFAVLARRRAGLEPIAAELRRAGIPYETASGRGFFDAPEIRDLTHLLRVLVNPRDEISLASVLRSPFVGINDETLLALKTEGVNLDQALEIFGGDRDSGPSEAEQPSKPEELTNAAPADSSLLSGIDPADTDRLVTFRRRLERLRRTRDDTAIDLLLSRAMSETGYETYLLSQPGGRHQVANVRKFLELARRQAAGTQAGFDALVSRIQEMRASKSPEAEAPVLDQSVDAVKLMTIHAAKGLEFPIVVLPALQSRPRIDAAPAGFSPAHGVGALWKDPAGGSARPDTALAAIRAEAKQREAEESNRLFYVAMTRAEEHLVLSCAFGPSGRAGYWAGAVKSKLGLDYKTLDETTQVKTLGDLRFRLFRTDRDPAVEPRADAASEASPVQSVEAVRGPLDHSDSAVAVSAVALFAECPRRYYLSRYLGFTEDREPAAPRLAHEGDEDTAAERDTPDPGELGSRVHAVLAGAAQPDPTETEVIELVRRFKESDLGRRVPPDARHEQDLLFSLDGRLLRGQIDLWFDDGAERVLVDYKTDRVEGEQIAERARQYALQLQLYARAIEQAAGRPPDRAVLYFLRPDTAVEVDVGAEARHAAAGVVNDFFEAQSKLRFPLQTGDHCFRCPHYQGLCPAKLGADQASSGG